MGSRVPLILAALAIVLSFLTPTAAKAQCEQSATFTGSSGQLLQDIGKERSSNLGLAVMPAFSCPAFDDWTVWGDVWNRFDASGLRLNETDLEGSITKSWGPVSLELYAAYFDLPPQPFRQGVVELYAGIGYSFDFGWIKVKPAIRPIHMIGVGGLADLTLLRARTKVEVPNFMHPAVTLALEPSVTYNFTRQPGLPEVAFRPEIALHYDFSDQVRLSLAGKAANRHKIIEGGMTIKF